MEIKDLKENHQLYLSGYFGAKIASNFIDYKIKNQASFLNYKKKLECGDCTIYITEENLLDFYEPSFSNIYQSEYSKKINDYIRKTIFKVENKEIREKIIEIANFDLSRNSSKHILNIEILVTCALRKPDYFFFIYHLLKEKYLYQEENDNFEFLIFSVYDAESKEEANKIYDSIMENAFNFYRSYKRVKLYNLVSVANDINSDVVQAKIDNNLQLIKI